jgi:hypothetical protein
MKKIFFLLLLFILFAGVIYGQEEGFLNLGFGMELNLNAPNGVAAGWTFGGLLMYASDPLSLGLFKFTVSNDLKKITTIEMELFFVRWRFLTFESIFLFVQGGIGASFSPQYSTGDLNKDGEIRSEDGERSGGSVLGAITVGMRFSQGLLYVEPYTRFGYPFMWGIGIMTGFRIG